MSGTVAMRCVGMGMCVLCMGNTYVRLLDVPVRVCVQWTVSVSDTRCVSCCDSAYISLHCVPRVEVFCQEDGSVPRVEVEGFNPDHGGNSKERNFRETL